MIRFGPAGNSENFYALGYKSSLEVPEYIEKMGLSAFEYQCGRGVRIGTEKARAMGEQAKKRDIALSVHAPYYISLASPDADKRKNSIVYILESARAVTDLGGDRIVIHAGSCGKMTREQALALAMETAKQAVLELDAAGFSHVRMCMETMGKLGQLGTLEEVLALCALDERILPCIDFGHLNARTHGGIVGKEDYLKVFEMTENAVGISRLREFHGHFSKIEYTTGGEKRHLTFEDRKYGPDFEPMLEICLRKNLDPTIICESSGTQAEDAKVMSKYYNNLQTEGTCGK